MKPSDEPIPGLRDFFASSALSCLGRDNGRQYPADVAKYCYEIADAMLIEREKTSATTK